mmetsp:Transcript_15491/g.41872  ORF Transcript_15491/g.41872 Transcript_15491/m.41872 type:complete len:235 (+) Transcript_15491:429-1133(+)
MLALVRGEAERVLGLDERHALPVKLFNGFVDFVPTVAERREAEALAPVAEVGRDHKEVLRLGEMLCKELAIFGLVRLGERADQHRHEQEVLALHYLPDVGQVHLERVLVLVRLPRHVVEEARLPQCAARLLVNLQRADRRAVLAAGRERAARAVNVVARPEKEDAANATRVDVLVRPRSRRPRVGVARVRRDDGARLAARDLRLAQPARELAGELRAVGCVPRAGVRGAACRHP